MPRTTPSPRIGIPSRAPGAIAILSLVLLFSPSRSPAEPISPQDGRALPPWFEEVKRRDPNAFTFGRAYIQQVQRLQENRRLIEQGRLKVEGGREELANLTVVTGVRKVPVFLGKFNNTGSGPITAANLQTELFDGPWPTGTMVEYYDEISYGNIQLQGTVYDWTTTSQNDTYYEGTSNGGDPANAHTGEFITEILTARDPSVNFGQYDNDGPDGVPNSGDDDGYVDFIGIVHPEIGAECNSVPAAANNIWSHRWSLVNWPEGVFTTNDPRSGGGFIKIDDYVIMPALSCGNTMIEIGVFCHEFGHAFGLPDLYDTNGGSAGDGFWCLMASGNWNSPAHPGHMSAWSKAFLGWITPTTVSANLLAWPILSSTTSPTAFKLWTNGTPGTEYFLVENRTQDGFDDQLKKAGLLVWHVDETVGSLLLNNVNTNEAHKRLDLECADQTGADHTTNADHLDSSTNRGDAGDPLCDGDSFTGASNPSSVAYNASPTNVAITNITGCGEREVRADLIVNIDQGPLANLCMRDCGADVCTEPSPCPKFWASPEVYVDNNLDGTVDPPAEGLPNNLIARVRNVGTTSASNVNVAFYYSDPAMGVLFPSNGTSIGTANVPLIPASGSETAMVTWTIPSPPPQVDHYCIGVIATNADDGQTSEFAPNDDNVVQINLQELYAKAGDAVPPAPAGSASAAPDALRASAGRPPLARTHAAQGVVFAAERVVRVCNPNRESCLLDIKIGSPPRFDDAVIPADWDVDLEYTSIFLPAGECTQLRVKVTDNDPVHLDFARIPLSLMCGNQVVGGTDLEFHIDNVIPPGPCSNFTAVQTPPFGGDDRPGAGLIRISWPDAFTDVLGFPERVERWRIYRMNDPATPPDPIHLLIETCRDEDPSTTPYDHFADLPSDPTQVWYKIVAVDRAGNESNPCLTQVTGPAPGTPTLEPGFPVALAAGAVSPPGLCQIDDDDETEIVFGDAAGNIQAYNHDGTPVPGWPINIGGIPDDSPVAVGDLDGDGHMEVVCGNIGGRVWAFHGNGTPVAGWPIVLGTNAPTFAAIGSLLPGPEKQVVAVSGDKVHLRKANGTSVSPFPLTLVSTIGAGAAIGDVDGDGDREIVVLQTLGMDVITAGGSVQAFRFPGGGASFAAAPSLADLNLDGDLEIVAPSQQGKLYVWNPNGSDYPGWPYTDPLGVPLTSAAVANVRAGFEPEVIFGVKSATSPRVHAFYQDGTELSGYPQSTGAGWYLFGAPIADILDEGSSDIVVGARDAYGHAWDNFGSPLPNWPVELGAGARCEVSPASGDIDQDGNVEVVFVSYENPSLVIFDLNAQVRRAGSVAKWYWPMFGYNPQRTHCFACPGEAVVAVDPKTIPAKLALRSPWPNPSSGRQSLRFELPVRARARLAIHDVAGREVRVLVDEELPAGAHDVSWDGAGRDGARLSPGVYYARLQFHGTAAVEERTQKLVLVW